MELALPVAELERPGFKMAGRAFLFKAMTKPASKRCPYCGELFVPWHSRQKCCGEPECKREMSNETRRDRRARDPEKKREYDRRWYAKNPEKRRGRARRRYAKNPEKHRGRARRLYAKNPEKRRGQARQWKARLRLSRARLRFLQLFYLLNQEFEHG